MVSLQDNWVVSQKAPLVVEGCSMELANRFGKFCIVSHSKEISSGRAEIDPRSSEIFVAVISRDCLQAQALSRNLLVVYTLMA